MPNHSWKCLASIVLGLKLTFNGRVIFIDKVALDELDGQAGFTDSTASDYDKLILAKELTWLLETFGDCSSRSRLIPLTPLQQLETVAQGGRRGLTDGK